MFDPLASLTSAITAGKTLFDLSVKMKYVEAQKLVMELNKALLEAQTEVHELTRENQRLQRELDASRDRPSDRVRLENGKYFLLQPAPGEHRGPYCVACYQKDGELVPLVPESKPLRRLGQLKCPVCKLHAD